HGRSPLPGVRLRGALDPDGPGEGLHGLGRRGRARQSPQHQGSPGRPHPLARGADGRSHGRILERSGLLFQYPQGARRVQGIREESRGPGRREAAGRRGARDRARALPARRSGRRPSALEARRFTSGRQSVPAGRGARDPGRRRTRGRRREGLPADGRASDRDDKGSGDAREGRALPSPAPARGEQAPGSRRPLQEVREGPPGFEVPSAGARHPAEAGRRRPRLMRSLRAALAAAAVLLASALANAVPAPAPATLLKVEARVERAPPGATLVVNATLEPGWHVNSHRPSEEYLIATTVKVEGAGGVRAGEPAYPEGMMKKFAFAEKPLSVYEGAFSIKVPVAFEGGK